jgi:N-methylhydantoinase A/oxoprolinase/acetone carboxylase beta subunit
MGHAIRAVTSRRGLDPRKFTLLSFGGAGGLHACALADSLEIPRVLIPPYCGVLSALGMVVTPPVVDVSKTVVHLGEQLDDARLVAEFGGLSGQTLDVIPYDQSPLVEAHADVRFRGQSHELKVRVDRPTRDHISQRFLEDYARAYGHAPTGRAIEIVTLRVRRTARIPELTLPKLQAQVAPPFTTEVVDADGQRRRVPVFSRAALLAPGPTAGPLLLIDSEATAYVTAGWQARANETGSVVLTRTGDSQ